jgi:GntR family transcriptional repressor for pyruvate dehydrogenase complex
MFDKIQERQTLSERVAHHIEQLIAENVLRPGDKLPPQRQLCAELGVSRTVVREAVHSLTAKGLLDLSVGRNGTTVRRPSADATAESMTLYLKSGRGGVQTEQVLEVRRALEPAMAKLAATRRTSEDLRVLESLAQIDLREIDGEGFVRWDEDFHTALARATHNEIFVLLLAAINSWMYDLRRRAADVLRIAPAMSEQHGLIVEMLKAQDAEGAYQAMESHLDEAAEIQQAASKLQEANRSE